MNREEINKRLIEIAVIAKISETEYSLFKEEAIQELALMSDCQQEKALLVGKRIVLSLKRFKSTR